MEQAYSQGNGCLGGKDTFHALEAGAVDILVLSKGFVKANPDYADICVAKAFEQGADVRVFGSVPSERLDEAGGGIGARLRFRAPDFGEQEAVVRGATE
jgi:peptide subunit release factor 1 (eRF1)